MAANKKPEVKVGLFDDDVEIDLKEYELEGEKPVVSEADDNPDIVIDEKADEKDTDKVKKPEEKADEDADDEEESSFRREEGENEIESEARRLRNKARRDESRDRRNRAAKRKDSRIAELERRLEDVQSKVSSVSHNNQIDIDIVTLRNAAEIRKTKLSEVEKSWKDAYDSGDSGRTLEAMSKLYEAKKELEQIEAGLNNALRVKQENRSVQASPVDQNAELVQSKAREFFRDNPWYDVNLSNRDSRRAKLISDELILEKFNPAYDDFWDELRDRVEKELPHRFSKKNKSVDEEGDDDEEEERKTVSPKKQPISTGERREKSPSSNERLSAESQLTALQRAVLAQSGYEKGSEDWKFLVKQYIAKNRASQNA